ncbi:Ku protein [Streptomyces sp. NPDC002587]
MCGRHQAAQPRPRRLEEVAITARPVWAGSLSFGLVSLPVGLYTATDSHTIHFHQLQRGTSDRIRNRRLNERTGDESTSPTSSSATTPAGSNCLALRLLERVRLPVFDTIHGVCTRHLACRAAWCARGWGVSWQTVVSCWPCARTLWAGAWAVISCGGSARSWRTAGWRCGGRGRSRGPVPPCVLRQA